MSGISKQISLAGGADTDSAVQVSDTNPQSGAISVGFIMVSGTGAFVYQLQQGEQGTVPTRATVVSKGVPVLPTQYAYFTGTENQKVSVTDMFVALGASAGAEARVAVFG